MRHSALRGLQRRLLDRSSDYQTAIASDSVLVIAPHPDDESIGCGGLIAMARRMDVDVQIAFVTYGEASHRPKLIGPERLKDIRREEAYEAALRLGVPRTSLHFFDVPDGRVY